MCRVEFFKIGNRDVTFIREMRVSKSNQRTRHIGEIRGWELRIAPESLVFPGWGGPFYYF